MDNLKLNEKGILYQLKQYRMKRYIKFFPEIDSTNDEAKRLCADGKGKNTVVIAASQTAGKGRLGRSFVSPAGTGVYFSVIYEINSGYKNLDLISSAAGLAVRDSIYNMFGLDTKIKWPNDVLVDDKKICGILCETVSEHNRIKYVVIGIGVNVERIDFEGEIEYTATSVGNEYSGEIELDHNEIVIDIINNLDRYILRSGLFTEDENREIINRIRASSATVGKMVRVITPDSEYDAKALDIADDGGLIVKGPVETTTLKSGEVVHIR